MKAIYVQRGDKGWELEVTHDVIAHFPDRQAAVEGALRMCNQNPGQYRVVQKSEFEPTGRRFWICLIAIWVGILLFAFAVSLVANLIAKYLK